MSYPPAQISKNADIIIFYTILIVMKLLIFKVSLCLSIKRTSSLWKKTVSWVGYIRTSSYMNCKVRADLPTPPLPTIITLCKPNCFSLAFDILELCFPLEVVYIFENIHRTSSLPSSEGSALPHWATAPKLRMRQCVTSWGVKSNHVTDMSCLFGNRVYKGLLSFNLKIPDLLISSCFWRSENC